MDEIVLKIRNKANEDYPEILLRKFFYMAFLNERECSVDVFIASVFGGVHEVEKNGPKGGKLPVSNYRISKDCSLEFQFSSNNIIERTGIEDLTTSFCNQTDWIEKVWGKPKELGSQKDIHEALENLYGNNYENISIDINQKYYCFLDEKNNKNSFIATPGKVEGKTNAYSLRIAKENMINGLEAINWVKTTIKLKDSFRNNLRNKRLKFSIVLEGTFYTPDFTWYFAPPIGTIVSDGEYKYEPKDATKAHVIDKNKIHSVADDTTVRFEEWDDEKIIERKKVRTTGPKEAASENLLALSNTTLNVSFTIKTDPEVHSNMQFLMGIVVAFLISLSADKTRIKELYARTHSASISCSCELLYDIIALILPIVTIGVFLSVCVNPKKKNISANFLSFIRGIGIWGGILLLLYVLIAPIFALIGLRLPCAPNLWIVLSDVFISMISCWGYILYCAIRLKIKFWDYLF